MKSKLLKAFGLAAIAVALVVVSVFGTVAYLTSSSAVANVFTVGNVGISMFESKVNSDGTKLDPNEGLNGTKKTADGNSYHLVPGKTYTKDPTIYIHANSEPSFLFLKVRNDIRSIETADAEKTMRAQLEAKGWEYHHENTSTGAIVYVYCDAEGNPKPVGGTEEQSVDIFDSFTIANDVEDVLHLYGGARVDLVAYAIQASGFADDADMEADGAQSAADKAWQAIVDAYPYESGAGSTAATTPATTE